MAYAQEYLDHGVKVESVIRFVLMNIDRNAEVAVYRLFYHNIMHCHPKHVQLDILADMYRLIHTGKSFHPLCTGWSSGY